MFDKQSDFTSALAKHLAAEGAEQTIELLICQWLLDNKVRFRNAGVTTGSTTTPEQQS